MRIVGQKADIHFGEVDEDEPNWRNELEEEIDPDDEELEFTPQSVIDILGFDPKEFSEPTSNKESNVMSLNTVKTLLILNAKKGWSDKARKAAALKRRHAVKVKKIQKKKPKYPWGDNNPIKPQYRAKEQGAVTPERMKKAKAADAKQIKKYAAKAGVSPEKFKAATERQLASSYKEVADRIAFKKKLGKSGKRPLSDFGFR